MAFCRRAQMKCKSIHHLTKRGNFGITSSLGMHACMVGVMEEKYRGEQLLYGDFSGLFGLGVQGNIEDVGRLYELLRDLDRSLFSGFVSFVLSKVEYYSKTICDISGSRTTDNDFSARACGNHGGEPLQKTL